MIQEMVGFLVLRYELFNRGWFNLGAHKHKSFKFQDLHFKGVVKLYQDIGSLYKWHIFLVYKRIKNLKKKFYKYDGLIFQISYGNV